VRERQVAFADVISIAADVRKLGRECAGDLRRLGTHNAPRRLRNNGLDRCGERFAGYSSIVETKVEPARTNSSCRLSRLCSDLFVLIKVDRQNNGVVD
jgi:hypothetical protein